MSKINNCLTTTFLCIMAFFYISCSSSNTNQTDSETIGMSDSVNYLKIPDASVALPGWSKENAIVYHTIAEPDILHPTNGTSIMRADILQYTQMFLVHTDFHTFEIAPGLLKSMPVLSSDGTYYDCELRNAPRWDDGAPITATDVVFTAMASKCPLTDNPQAKPYWDNLKEIIVDPSNKLKFRVVMKTPYMHNLIFWADWPIMQQQFFDKANVLGNFTFNQFNDSTFNASASADLTAWANEFNSVKYSREPEFLAGAGMYRVSAWDPGQSVTLERKKNHWTKGSVSIYETSYPEKIIYKVNQDPNSQILDFKAQVLDGSNLISTKALLELQADSNFINNYNSRFTDSFNYTYVGMNTKPDGIKHKKIFTDKKVRRAMALLTPVDDLNRIINKGKNKRMVGPVSILKSDFDTTLKALPLDKIAAKKLLEEAGWNDSNGDNILDKMIDGKKQNFEFTINYMTNTPDWKDYATLLAEAYTAAGMKVNLNPLDFAVFIANAKLHDFDMIVSAWGQPALPEDFTQLWHSSSWENQGSNYTGFGNAQSDALIDSLKKIMDPQIRKPLVHEFQQLVYDEQPMIFLFASLRRNVIHKRFGNVEMYFERPGILLNNLKLLSANNPTP